MYTQWTHYERIIETDVFTSKNGNLFLPVDTVVKYNK